MMLKILAIIVLILKTIIDIVVETAPLFKKVIIIIVTKIRFLFKEISPVFGELVKEIRTKKLN